MTMPKQLYRILSTRQWVESWEVSRPGKAKAVIFRWHQKSEEFGPIRVCRSIYRVSFTDRMGHKNFDTRRKAYYYAMRQP